MQCILYSEGIAYTLQSACKLVNTFNSAYLCAITILMILIVTKFYGTTVGTDQPVPIPTELSKFPKPFINIYSQKSDMNNHVMFQYSHI
jgi:hypothetical protein